MNPMVTQSRCDPGTMTDASDCEPVLVDESTEEPTSFLFDYSLPKGDQICDQTSAENSPSDEDDTLLDADDCGPFCLCVFNAFHF